MVKVHDIVVNWGNDKPTGWQGKEWFMGLEKHISEVYNSYVYKEHQNGRVRSNWEAKYTKVACVQVQYVYTKDTKRRGTNRKQRQREVMPGVLWHGQLSVHRGVSDDTCSVLCTIAEKSKYNKILLEGWCTLSMGRERISHVLDKSIERKTC